MQAESWKCILSECNHEHPYPSTRQMMWAYSMKLKSQPANFIAIHTEILKLLEISGAYSSYIEYIQPVLSVKARYWFNKLYK